MNGDGWSEAPTNRYWGPGWADNEEGEKLPLLFTFDAPCSQYIFMLSDLLWIQNGPTHDRIPVCLLEVVTKRF